MAETPHETAVDNADDLRGKLIKRLAVAGVLVAILLGILAFFDYLAAPEEPEPAVFPKPVPVAPKKEVTQPVTPAVNPPEPPPPPAPEVESAKAAEKPGEKPVDKAGDKAPEKTPEKVGEGSAAPVAPVKPTVAPTPVAAPQSPPGEGRNVDKGQIRPAPREARVVTSAPPRPAGTVPASAGPVSPVAPVKPQPPVVPEMTAPPRVTVPDEASVAPPPAKAVAPAPVLIQPPSPPRLFSGYVLSAGVFSSAQRAEELHAKLTLNGIPSTLEARVQVGPFKTKAEAEAAKAKLQALGIDTQLLAPRSGKH